MFNPAVLKKLMTKCYINGAACISAQNTFEGAFPDGAIFNTSSNVLPALKLDYKEFIAPAAGRRMAHGVKNGISASARALKEAGITGIDAIITGTGMGCNVDSQKFLQAVIDNKEEFLTPTSFIQSTHNTVGAQIALELQSQVYNFVYVNGAISFESALIDAKLQIEEGEAATVLVGGIEELAENRIKLFELSGEAKDMANAPFSVLESTTGGAVISEGAMFMVLSDTVQESTYAEIKDVSIYNVLLQDEVQEKLEAFLKVNNLSPQDIDAVVLGYNGDVDFDGYYTILAEGIFASIPQLYYKHLSGEYHTASSFGLWIAAQAVKEQQIHEVLRANHIPSQALNNILLYNQYRGKDHSFTLISKV